MTSKTGNKAQGYLLLELTLSIGIITLGLLFILKGFSAALRYADLAADISRACILAENTIEEIEFKLGHDIDVPRLQQKDSDLIAWSVQLDDIDNEQGLELCTFKAWRKTLKKEPLLEVNTYVRQKG